jgi:hypothetical protein
MIDSPTNQAPEGYPPHPPLRPKRGGGNILVVVLLTCVVALAVILGFTYSAFKTFITRQSVGGAVTATAFDVQVGSKKYQAELDKPFTVETPRGERLTAVVRSARRKQFSGAGVRFEFPPSLRLAEEREMGVTTLTLDCADSPVFMIQVYPPVDPKDVEKALQEEYVNQFKTSGLKPIGKTGSASRMIGGSARKGSATEFVLVGTRLRVETFVFSEKKRTIAVAIQYSSDEKVLAEDLWRSVADSLVVQ